MNVPSVRFGRPIAPVSGPIGGMLGNGAHPADWPQSVMESRTFVRFWDICRLAIGSTVAQFAVFVASYAFGVPTFGALSGVAMACLGFGTFELLELAGARYPDIPDLGSMPTTLRGLPVAIAVLAGVAPVCEELICLCLVFDWLRQRLSLAPAVLISSLWFALLHVPPFFKYGLLAWVVFVVHVPFGIVAAYFAIRTRSLTASVVTHAAANRVCVATAMLARG